MTARLIEDILKAAAGSQVLDARVWWEVDYRSALTCFNNAALGPPLGGTVPYPPPGLGRAAIERMAPHYTRSLDPAKAIVDAGGWQWSISNRTLRPHTGRAHINNGELQFIGSSLTRNPRFKYHEETAMTPELALCAVMLRAKDEGYLP